HNIRGRCVARHDPQHPWKAAPISIPSLHIFGTETQHKQVDTEENEALVKMFSEHTRTVIRHGAGHIIPTGKTMIAEYKAFLRSFYLPK
ncbi:hypothetical protein CYMTET_22976, partial [Cymbomonas tetramitiformis]